MSDKSDIEWTDATWNPVRGCVKVSPGCKHCYAETFAERFRGVPGHPYEQGFDVRLVPEKLEDPIRWQKPRRIFVNSMSDLFQEDVPDDYVARVFAIMATATQHTFQVLTKRAERMRELLTKIETGRVVKWGQHAGMALPDIEWLHGRTWQIWAQSIPASQKKPYRLGEAMPWPLPNVHLGVSVEDRKYGVPRIDHLRRTPAAVRFLSIEPLLEDVGTLDLTGIHQVIVGAESGHRARPMREDWVRSIRDQAVAQGVAFFYKQRLEGGRKVSLPMLDGRQWAEMP